MQLRAGGMSHLYVYSHRWRPADALSTGTQPWLNEQMNVLLRMYFWHRLNGKSLRLSCKLGHLHCEVGIPFKKHPRTTGACRKFKKSSLSQ